MLRNLGLTVSILVLSVFVCKPMPMSTNLKNRIKEYEDRGEPLPVTLLAARYNSQRVDAMNKKIDDAREVSDRNYKEHNRRIINEMEARAFIRKQNSLSRPIENLSGGFAKSPIFSVFIAVTCVIVFMIYKKVMSGRGDFKRKRVRGGLLRRVFSV